MQNEVEIAYIINPTTNFIDALIDKVGAKLQSIDFINDVYYYNEHVESTIPKNFNIDDCVRVRTKNRVNKCVTIKRSVYDENGVFSHARELECGIHGNAVEEMLELLGNKVLVEVSNLRATLETANYFICLDNVDGLDTILEVEYKYQCSDDKVESVKEGIREFVASLDVDAREQTRGKPELLLEAIAMKGNE